MRHRPRYESSYQHEEGIQKKIQQQEGKPCNRKLSVHCLSWLETRQKSFLSCLHQKQQNSFAGLPQDLNNTFTTKTRNVFPIQKNEVKAPYRDSGEPSKTRTQPLIFSARGQTTSLSPRFFYPFHVTFLSVLCYNPPAPWLPFHAVMMYVMEELNLFHCVAGERKEAQLGTVLRCAEFQTPVFPQVARPDLQSEQPLEWVCPQVPEPGLAQPPRDKPFCSGYRSIVELESGFSHPKERQRMGE